MINKLGYGELFLFIGFIFVLGGYYLFELVNIKGDFGVLIFGIMLV